METNTTSDVAHKFHKDYDAAAEAAEIAGNEELATAARAASEAYDLVGLQAIISGNDSAEFKGALEAAKVAANNYAALKTEHSQMKVYEVVARATDDIEPGFLVGTVLGEGWEQEFVGYNDDGTECWLITTSRNIDQILDQADTVVSYTVKAA